MQEAFLIVLAARPREPGDRYRDIRARKPQSTFGHGDGSLLRHRVVVAQQFLNHAQKLISKDVACRTVSPAKLFRNGTAD